MKYFSPETRQRMSESAKKRCTEEWLAKKRATATLLDTEKVKELYEKNHTQREIASMLGVSQKVIYRHMKNHGLATRPKIKRNQFGENNATWRGGRTEDEAGYVMVKKEGHPRASICGAYVQEHVLVVEQHLGRLLVWNGKRSKDTEIVHHINGVKNDNRIENLFVCNYSDHRKIHNAIRRGKNVVYEGSTFILGN